MNIERFRQVLEMIEANPEHWNQGYYHCGTSHCFGGFCDLVEQGLVANTEERGPALLKLESSCAIRAQMFLEINKEEAGFLFACCRTLEDFRLMLAEGRILPLVRDDEQTPF